MPSREDPWPLVVVEAMMAGLPVLASDAVGSAPDLVESGRTGLVFSARDAAALAACFEQAERCDLAELGARARERAAECCSLDRCVESFKRAVGAAAAPSAERIASTA
jgi:glycosyltransferase involved in cell wall biosynthesis